MKFLFKTILLGCIIMGNSCNLISSKKESGIMKEEERSVETYCCVEIKGTCKVVLTNSEQNKIRVIAGEKIISDILVESKKDTLYVLLEGLSDYNLKGTTVYIPANNLKTLAVKGGGELISEFPLKAEEFSCDFEGAVKIDMELHTQKLSVIINGSGVLNLKGRTDNFNLRCNGSTHINTAKLLAKKVKLEASGSNSISLYSEEVISGEVKDASNAVIYGNPTDKNLIRSSVGRVYYR